MTPLAHTSRLAAALHAEVADVQPDHRLDEVLDRAHRRLPTYVIALAGTVLALLLIAAAFMQVQRDDVPAQPTIRFQEA